MYSRQEASRVREEFWTAFGRYMSPVPSAEGLKINWINYHTKVKDVYFRMDAGPRAATIAISLEHRDAVFRQLFFEQFLAFKNVLHATLGEEWTWEEHTEVQGRTISRIFHTMDNVSVFNQDHWPQLISFFKPRIIALDAFWENAKYSFDALM